MHPGMNPAEWVSGTVTVFSVSQSLVEVSWHLSREGEFKAVSLETAVKCGFTSSCLYNAMTRST